ncbi:unnamed protein product [Discosporangium mesarthrocarpum]
MFVKPHKVGSSSMANLVRLIVARNGGIRREFMYPQYTADFFARAETHSLEEGPHIWADHHNLSYLMEIGEPKIIQESFKVTLVRDPVDRCLSSFYYYDIERENLNRNQMSEKELTRRKMEFNQCSKNEKIVAQMSEIAPKGDESSVEETLAFYDLIGITGRYMESLAVMKMLLGLRYGDMLHFNDKFHPEKRPPITEEPSRVIEHVKTLIPPADWDLFNAANQRLSETIRKLEPEFSLVHSTLVETMTNSRLECDKEHGHVGKGYMLPYGFGCFSQGSCKLSCLNKYATDNGLWDAPEPVDLGKL